MCCRLSILWGSVTYCTPEIAAKLKPAILSSAVLSKIREWILGLAQIYLTETLIGLKPNPIIPKLAFIVDSSYLRYLIYDITLTIERGP